MSAPRFPLVLVIRDGWGVREEAEGNVIQLASLPVLTRLLGTCPHTEIGASGEAVGLPCGVMGNSEVGHMNFGAGRIVRMDVTRIDAAVANGSFASNLALAGAIGHARGGGGGLHLIGLCSDGLVHASLDHLDAILRSARDHGLDRVYLHALTDGRDTAPDSGRGFLAGIEERMAGIGVGRTATVMGRYYAMDRDGRWDRVKQAYDAVVHGEGVRAASSAEAVAGSYAEGVTDEFIRPRVVTGADGEPIARVQGADVLYAFNFRSDRMRQIIRAFTERNFTDFDRRHPVYPHVATMTRYDDRFDLPVAFDRQLVRRPFAEVVSDLGLRQLRIAETEKYAHVTFFFSCGREIAWPGEERVLVPSPKVATYDLKPTMSAEEVTDELVGRIAGGGHEVIVANYANADMVGHTGSIPATVEAVETVDRCVGRVEEAVARAGGTLLISADHGNCEMMIDPVSGGPHTAHTTNPVHFILALGREPGTRLRGGGRLCDVAPTLLDLIGIEPPAEMTGRSLLEKGTGTIP